jgi:hypothetical protein
VPAPISVVGVGTPDVKGMLEAEEAPVKAGAPSVAVELGPWVALGLRTLGVRQHFFFHAYLIQGEGGIGRLEKG